ncbi:MAG: ATP-binding protein [Planctomycetota bacterium]
MQFKKAVKSESRLRMALVGPSGAGKTYTALKFASAFAQKRVALIDTERGSASKYADTFDFDVLDLENHSPIQFVKAIAAAANTGEHDVLVIDSLSHAWMGRGGALEQVDRQASTMKGNSFGAWASVTPLHNQLIDAMIGAPLHVIATMRAKSEWLQDVDDRGKKVIRKVGTQAVQRDGMEFEFDVVAEMEPRNNELVVTKTRCPALAEHHEQKPDDAIPRILLEWLAGVKTPFVRACDAILAAQTPAELDGVVDLVADLSEAERQKARSLWASRREKLRANEEEANNS